jgi:hypothetical protein
MPEITEASKHIMLEETKEGLNIEIVDQDGRSMFPDAAKEPFERTRKLIQKIAPQLKATPYRLPSLVIPLQARCRLSPAMGHGNCLPIVRTPYARFWTRRVCRQGTSIWWPARPKLIRFFRTILTFRRTAGSR